MFNTFHVPLIDDNDNFLVGAWIDLSEEVLVSFIYKNLLHLGEVNVHVLDIPVDKVWIEALLSELSWFGIVHSINNVSSLSRPITETKMCPIPPDILEESVSSLMN